MNYLTLKQIKELISKEASKINTPESYLPTFGVNEDFARPEIRVDGKGYHYVIAEKGQEIKHQITNEVDKLLYWVFKDITFEMACAYEVRNRIEGQDFRRLLYYKQLELINLMEGGFLPLLKADIEETLKRHHFKD